MQNILNIQTVENLDNENDRIRGAKYPELESPLYLWYHQMCTLKNPISNEIFIEKAKKIFL